MFYDGAGYADHCQLKLKKTVDAPTIKTSMTAPNYEEKHSKIQTYYMRICLFLCWQKHTLSRQCRQSGLRCAKQYHRNFGGCPQLGVFPHASSEFYQPYQIDASIEFNWTGSATAYTGPAPYGYNSTTQPYAPFYLTEYKLDGTDLWGSAATERERRAVRLTMAVRSASPCSLPRKTEGISSTICPSNCI